MAAMTVTEFARIYQIPHSIVYNASFRVPFEERKYCDGDYRHEALKKATIAELTSRNAFHQGKLDKNNKYLKQLAEDRDYDE